jgi:hypothetical protein
MGFTLLLYYSNQMEAASALTGAGVEELTYENVLFNRRVFPRFALFTSTSDPTSWPADGPTPAQSVTTMSSELANHCEELVRVLQDDVVRMCDNMLLE